MSLIQLVSRKMQYFFKFPNINTSIKKYTFFELIFNLLQIVRIFYHNPKLIDLIYSKIGLAKPIKKIPAIHINKLNRVRKSVLKYAIG
jgi:hypothetical protein